MCQTYLAKQLLLLVKQLIDLLIQWDEEVEMSTFSRAKAKRKFCSAQSHQLPQCTTLGMKE